MEPRDASENQVTIVPGVIQQDWDALVVRGKSEGVVHAEDVAHVVRDVELTPEVLTLSLIHI